MPGCIALAVVLIRDGLENDNTAVPVAVLLETSVNVAPAISDTAPLIVSKLGLYWRVKLPDVTPKPLLSATGMPGAGNVIGNIDGRRSDRHAGGSSGQ